MLSLTFPVVCKRLVIFAIAIGLLGTGLFLPSTSNLRIASAATSCENVTQIPASECNTLLAFYASTSGSNWIDHTDWNVTNTPCSWTGIICVNGHVTALILYNNNLTGTLPSFNGLPNLTSIQLENNQLSGSLPALTGLLNLQNIQLQYNQLSGVIPALTGLTNLQYLDLNNNLFSGTLLPLDGLTNLKEINLERNRLSGTLPTFSGLTNLKYLYLGSNQFTGSVPDLPPSLIVFYVSVNFLNGTIPDSITGTAITQSLDLCGGNLLTPADSSVNAFIAARVPYWTGACSLSDTIGVYRPSSRTFYLSLHNSTGNANLAVAFAAGTKPYPVVGDWTGTGSETIGIYDQANGQFTLCTANYTAVCAHVDYRQTLVLGVPNDLPLSGRWLANEPTDGVGVFRPSNGLIYLKNALTTGYADHTMVLGIPGDIGLANDWNHQGFDSPGVYRSINATFYLSNQVCNCSVYADEQVAFGLTGDLPIAAVDWIGVYRPSTVATYLKRQLVTGDADLSFTYGIVGDIPLAGHWQTSLLVNSDHPAPLILLPKPGQSNQPGTTSVFGGNQIGD